VLQKSLVWNVKTVLGSVQGIIWAVHPVFLGAVPVIMDFAHSFVSNVLLVDVTVLDVVRLTQLLLQEYQKTRSDVEIQFLDAAPFSTICVRSQTWCVFLALTKAWNLTWKNC
jgi:hypothetical protein